MGVNMTKKQLQVKDVECIVDKKIDNYDKNKETVFQTVLRGINERFSVIIEHIKMTNKLFIGVIIAAVVDILVKIAFSFMQKP
jgi:hypothetical protein